MASSDSRDADAALLGMLALLAAEREPTAQPPTEVLLARVGLGYEEIGLVVGKSAEAVRKAATRAGISKSSPGRSRSQKKK